MANVAAREVYSPPDNKPAPGNKTVQEYIDELPVWSDGTTLKSTPMTGMQWRIWALAASGKFFEGFVVFMGGVTVPLITREFGLSAGEAGLVTSASLAGILVGTILLGGLSDYFGRKLMFIAEMIIFCLFLALLIMVGDFLIAGDLPVRHRHGARLRLPDRAHDHLREHSQRVARPPCARRLRLPGGGRHERHRGRRAGARARPEHRCLAVDVRDRAGAGSDHHRRPLLHHGKRQLADRARRARTGRKGRDAPARP